MYTLTIFVTNICNLNCKYCFIDKSKREFKLDWSKNFEKTLEKFFNTQGDIKKISIMGGEPLLNTKFLTNLINFINKTKNNYKNKKISFAPIPTNGTIYDEKFYKLLKLNNIELKFSVDHYLDNIDINRVNLLNEGVNYSIVKQNIKNYKNIFGFFPGIGIVINNSNVDILFELIKSFIEDIGIKYIHIGVSFGFNLNNDFYNKFIKSYSDIFNYYIDNINLGQNFSIDPIEFILADSFRGGINNPKFFINRNQICGMGNEISISFDGNIYSCDLMAGSDYINSEIKEKYLIGSINTGVDYIKAKKDVGNMILTSFSNFGKKLGISKKICYLFDSNTMKFNNTKNYVIMYKINFYIYNYVIKNINKLNSIGIKYFRDKYGLYGKNKGVFK